ncbi:MAG: hypothetical protein ABJL67_05605 [Sulfitobacter sp.]
MLRALFLGIPICLAGFSGAFAAENRTYFPGFTGRVSQFMVPVDASNTRDRFLTIKITMAQHPKASDIGFDNAFRAVCLRHQGELRKRAGKISRHNDWRMKVTFAMPLRDANGISVDLLRSKVLWLSNCRFQ